MNTTIIGYVAADGDGHGLFCISPTQLNGNLDRDWKPVMSVDVAAAAAFLQDSCHFAAVNAGWWTDFVTGDDLRAVIRDPNSRLGKALIAEKLCLIHSEVSEAMEGSRKSLMDDKLPHRTMLEVELADAAIRIADLAGALGFDLGAAIAEKMAFNQIREDHRLENRNGPGGKAY